MTDETHWNSLLDNYPQGSIVEGLVTTHHSFGVELKIEGFECQCLIEVTEFKKTGRINPEDFPSIGATVKAQILGYTESPCAGQVCKLSLKNMPDLHDKR